jgi:hypothetical protein
VWLDNPANMYQSQVHGGLKRWHDEAEALLKPTLEEMGRRLRPIVPTRRWKISRLFTGHKDDMTMPRHCISMCWREGRHNWGVATWTGTWSAQLARVTIHRLVESRSPNCAYWPMSHRCSCHARHPISALMTVDAACQSGSVMKWSPLNKTTGATFRRFVHSTP